MTLLQTSVRLPRKRPQRPQGAARADAPPPRSDHLESAANVAICSKMGVESATEPNECAHCYAFDAARNAIRPTCSPHPRSAVRPANRKSDPPTAANRTCTLVAKRVMLARMEKEGGQRVKHTNIPFNLSS